MMSTVMDSMSKALKDLPVYDRLERAKVAKIPDSKGTTPRKHKK